MPLRSRSGTLLLLVGGLVLVGWMGYALTYSGGSPGDADRATGGLVEVAVFLPDRTDWADFSEGVAACEGRGLVREVVEGPDTIAFRTAEHGRAVRLSWVEGGGVVATRERVARLLDRPEPPAAFVGSNNTVLTAALAEALAGATERRNGARPDPVLLVPWATSVRVHRPGAASVPLLGLYPERTFRFCPNNRQEAELVARVAADRAGVPVRAVVVVDGNDPYSRDLAEGFDQALAAVAPEAEVITRRFDLSAPGPIGADDRPGPVELDEADRIWRFAADAPGDGPIWAMIPLQGSPTRRMIRALIDRSGPIGPRVLGRLHVLCGDGIGRSTLDGLAGRCTLPVWCVSSGTMPGGDRDPTAPESSQVPAEIVAALALVLDRPAESGGDLDLAAALGSLDLPAGSPAAFGRSLAFDSSGERRADDLGHVLAIFPGRAEVLAYGPIVTDDLGELPGSPSGDASLVRR